MIASARAAVARSETGAETCGGMALSMICERCQAQLVGGEKFCGRCGHPVQQPTAEASTPPEGSRAIAPATNAAAQASTVPIVPTGGALWIEVKDMWSKVRSRELIAAGTLTALGLVTALVGLAMTSSSSVFGAGKAHGLIWGALADVLSVIAVGWYAAASSRFQEGRTWAVRRDLRIAQAVGAVALLFSLVGLIVSYGSNPASAQADGTAWFGFAGVWTFLCFGWLIMSRPVKRREALVYAAVLGGIATLCGIVGLALGLGSSAQDYVQGAAWLAWAFIWALLGTAALLSRTAARPGE